MILFDKKDCVRICLKNTNKYVARAADDLVADFARVSACGVRPTVSDHETESCIVIEENTRLSAEPIEDESFSICVRGGKVVISADGYLGTMWGIYTFSERFLGVDPCYLFNDLEITPREKIEIPDEIRIEGKPNGFGFRGVFVNDEDLLGGWRTGGGARYVGGGFYAITVERGVIDMVVETILRLKLNLVIPATFLDIDNPPEKTLADAVAERGIYLSQHHCEPLGVSSFTFENYCRHNGIDGKFSYSECPDVMEKVWAHYVGEWAKYDNVVWQIGLRGMGDDRPVWQDDVPTEEVLRRSGDFISRAYEREKEIILAATDGKAKHFTSTLWMEGSTLVEKGYLRFPDDVIMVFADTSPTQIFGDEYDKVEREKGAKYGIYYHLQYYGCGPHLAPQTGLKKLHYNMARAFEKGDTSYFIMNVSNVREFTFELAAYAEAAWNTSDFSPEEYLDRYCADYGELSGKIKRAITDYFDSFPVIDSKYLEKHLRKYFNYASAEPPEGITNFVLKEGSILGYGWQITGDFDKDLSQTLCSAYYEGIKRVIPDSDRICAEFEEITNALDEPKKTHVKVKWLLAAKTLNYIYKWYTRLYEAKIYRDERDGENMKRALGDACAALEDYLSYRKCAEYGKFENWYRGEVKMNVNRKLLDTKMILGQTPDFTD